MQSGSDIPLKDLVLLGGGHAHVHVLKMLAMNPIPHLRITLISRDIESPYSGMIPGYIAGYYTREECHIDIYKLAAFANIRFLHAEATSMDAEKKLIFFSSGRPPVRYDLLSIDIGIIPKPLPALIHNKNKEMDLCITPVKPIDRFAWKWQSILDKFVARNVDKHFTLLIVGGGAGGAELAFSINFRLKTLITSQSLDPALVEVVLLNKSEHVMSKHSKLVSEMVEKMLAARGVAFHNETEIVDALRDPASQQKFLVSATGVRFSYDEVVWCTEGMGQPWLASSGLAVDEDNCVLVQPTLESSSHRGVFAAGDVCHNVRHPRPKAGVFAVRAGPPLLDNLRRSLFGEPLVDWTPQDEFLGLIGTGFGHAIASKGGMALEGSFLWELKDKIDRTWMRPYQQLPTMAEMAEKRKLAPPVPEAERKELEALGQPEVRALLQKSQMRCAGCGSKVGASVITRAFQRLQLLEKTARQPFPTSRAEIVAGIGDDAAVMRVADPRKLLVQTIDYFRSFVADPFLFGQIAANHALSDVFAMNGEAVTAMALCVLPYGPEAAVEDELVHMLAGMKAVLAAEQCALVGGHTSEGQEPALGLAVTGLVDPGRVFNKGPILHLLGHHLVLTKPLGTGTLLAAHMRNQAKGRWMAAAFESMRQSNAPAARVLSRFDCAACTDVTGFGLLGHLVEMARHQRDEVADGQPAGRVLRLWLGRVPALEGAEESSRLVVSSLFPQNVRAQQFVRNPADFDGHAMLRLLFDPQTSGGLLALVPASQSAQVVEELVAAGYSGAAVIGEVVEAPSEGRDEDEDEDEDFAYLIELAE